MKRIVVGVLAAAVVAVVGVVVWFFASTNIDDPVDVTAPALDGSDDSAAETVATIDGSSTQPDETVATTDGSSTQPDERSGGLFELTDESRVVFEIDEELRGQPVTVVATNGEVAAQLRFDPADLGSAEIGTVVIGAQTFETDSGNRNRAIRGPILDSDVFPTIEFTPTAIRGLEGSVSVGETRSFTVEGDLTIRDVTNPVTFDVEVTLAAADRLEGTASAMVLRSDFDLQIPSVPSVANVGDEISVSIEFVAAPLG